MSDGPDRSGGTEVTGGPAAVAPTALVTGAGGHLGRALLPRLAAAGYRTIGVDRPEVVGLVPDPRTDRPDRWLAVDLVAPSATPDLTHALADVTELDLVIAAAGTTALGDVTTTSDATFEQVMAVNYHGALRTTRAALPALRAAGGYLVVLSSVAGLLPVPGRPAYVGAKHAVTGTFLALADELASAGVAVTVVHPGFLATPVTTATDHTEATRSTTGGTLDADEVARRILRLAARHRAGRRPPARVLVGRTARLADVVARMSPGAARALAVRRLRS